MELLTNDEKKDLVLNYFKEKYYSKNPKHDSDNTQWNQLANKTCGGNNIQFHNLVESLVPTYLGRENGLHITPEGLGFEGFAEMRRQEREAQELDLEHKKAMIQASAQKTKTPIWTILSTIFGIAGTISTAIFAYINLTDKQEIKELKQEIETLNHRNIKLRDSMMNIKSKIPITSNPHPTPHPLSSPKTKSP